MDGAREPGSIAGMRILSAIVGELVFGQFGIFTLAERLADLVVRAIRLARH
jgi:hypothetical protein